MSRPPHSPGTAAALPPFPAVAPSPIRPAALAATPALALGALAPGALALGALTLGCALLAARHGSPGVTAMAAIALASLVSSIAGFAFSAICGAMLFHLWDDQVRVVQVMIACSIANQIAMVWALRRDIEWDLLGRFMLGGLAGLPVGAWVLLHADRAVYTHLLGVLMLAYGLSMLVARTRAPMHAHPPHRSGLDIAIGFAGGITGGAAGFPGGPVTIWCGRKGWDKARQRALFQPFILLMQIAALLVISAAGATAGHGAGFDPANLLCLPAGLLGTWLGMACFRRMSNRQFALAVNAMLIASGLGYIV